MRLIFNDDHAELQTTPNIFLRRLNRMPTREEAWNLLCEWTRSDSLRKHARAVEYAMRTYARKYGEDEDKWGIVGMLHDFDYERYRISATRNSAPKSCARTITLKTRSARSSRMPITPGSNARA